MLAAGLGQVVPGLAALGIGLRGEVEVAGRLKIVLLLVGLDAALEVDLEELAGIGRALVGTHQVDVVLAPPLGVGEDVERLGDVLELLLGASLLRPLEAVGVTGARQLPEALTDLLLSGVARHREHGVEIPGHRFGLYFCLILYNRRAVERKASGILRSRPISRRSRTDSLVTRRMVSAR